MTSLLLSVAAIAGMWTIVVAVTGGTMLRLGSLAIGLHSLAAPAIVCVATAALLLIVAGPARIAVALERSWRSLESFAPWAIHAVVLVTIVVAWSWGTFTAGGSDSYCYVSQAHLFAERRTFAPAPIPDIVPWPMADRTFSPAGHVPAVGNPGASVPMCPAGLSLAMALLIRLVGATGAFLAVPLLGGLAVWLTYRLGRQLHGPIVGLTAGALLACSPIFLYQVVQPMNDVPAAAWWLAAWLFAIDSFRSPSLPPRGAATAVVSAGLATSMALLTRPNLLPVAAVLALFIAVRQPQWFRRLVWYGAGVSPGVIAIGWLNLTMYGSPLRSGYGDLQNLFAFAHGLPNLQRYATWLVTSHTPFVLVALLAPLLTKQQGRPLFALLAMASATLACYLPYAVFDDWSYLRFLLPALPPLIVLASLVTVEAIGRAPAVMRTAVLVAVITLLGSWWVRTAETHSAFKLWALERHFIDAGRYVATRLPARAVVFAAQESGSVRFYSGRATLVWDMFDPIWFDRAFAFLEERGYAPYILIEGLEEPLFKSHFKDRSVFGALDWPPKAQIGATVRVYDPADRRRYLTGEPVSTERVPSSAR